MQRREFIRLLGGTAIAWPLAARAQQPRMPVIGFLSGRSHDEAKQSLTAFRSGLRTTGHVGGQNVVIEYRWAEGEYIRLPELAADLVQRGVAVLAATGGQPAALAAKAATASIPIVATFSDDPVASGLVASLNRPGGNVTGVSNLATTLEPKRLGLLRDLVPQAATFGVLLNPTFPAAASQLGDMQEAARTLGLQIHVLQASIDREIETAFDSIAQHRIPALAVAADPFFNSRRDKLAALAARHAVPAMYAFREFAAAGGLMSYGIDLDDVYRQIGVYAGRVLKGVNPADLPVLQPTKFEFVINLNTAKALGIKLSDNLLSLADEVIE
jgi:putative tryptophan/tyrosine transport system substrate-binding protein